MTAHLTAPEWLARAGSAELAAALAMLRVMAAEPALFDPREELRLRYGALAMRAEAAAGAGLPSTAAADLAAFAVDAIDVGPALPAVRLGIVPAAFATAYVRRADWLPGTLRGIAILGLLGVLAWGGNAALELRRAQLVDAERRAAATARAAVEADAASVAALLADIDAFAAPAAVRAPVDTLRRDARARVAAHRAALASGSRPMALAPELRRLSSTMHTWAELADGFGGRDDLPDALQSASAVLHRRFESAAATGDLPSARSVAADLQRLLRLGGAWANRPVVTAASDDARRALAAVDTQLQHALTEGDPTAIERALEAEARLARFIGSTYSVQIIDRPGERTGTERCPSSGGRHRLDDCPDDPRTYYYILVEPIDAAGQRLAALVTDEETQQPKWVHKYGVRVSKATYAALREEKIRTHRVGNRLAGEKPVGHLTPAYSLDIVSAAATITEW